MNRPLGILLLCVANAACSRPPSDSPAPTPHAATGLPAPSLSASAAAPPEGEAWLLSGSEDERFARVAKHLRGFDVAMVETGHRYGELYWAGNDRNWGYAQYQIDKIRTAVRNGVERRPKRATSAKVLDGALPALEEAVKAKDAKLFMERFKILTDTCNTCHQAERVPFVHVRPPVLRTSVVEAPPEDGGAP